MASDVTPLSKPSPEPPTPPQPPSTFPLNPPPPLPLSLPPLPPLRPPSLPALPNPTPTSFTSPAIPVRLFVPEFFDGRSPSKNPRVYKYYRNAIIRRFRENPNRKITFTEVRKTIVGDVGSIRRVFDFLEAWGLINYAGSTTKPQLKWEDKETKSAAAAAAQGGDAAAGGAGADVAVAKKRICSGCKAACTIACFASDKVLAPNSCAIDSEEAKTDWSDKETLQLLEAIMHYGDDWKKVAEHVGGRTVKECVARFIKLPFGEQFDGPPESAELDMELGLQNVALPNKRMRLSPLADASNPIMAQAAFLSTLVGVDVAEVAARAAVTALSDLGDGKQQATGNVHSDYRWKSSKPMISKRKLGTEICRESGNASNGNNRNMTEAALAEAKLQLEKEEEELEKAISGIATQTMEIEDKIIHFEDFELQMERKRQHFQQLQNRLFADQLTLLFNKTAASKMGENIGEAVKIE
ncbi:UNVERIFIED_CONTAM: SWI/SNF complex subunit SWI3B [Sesamum radiatum]|uniref:SWI/SNF complex subunit SWI3B n=1 Tax=Sesamum radiatum TaxID=300843 RepID=A0AAW2SIE4_SESRA